jgi:hypothetical protein
MQTLKKKQQQTDYIQMKHHFEVIKLFKDRHIMTGIDSKQVDKDVELLKSLLRSFTNGYENND